MSKYIRVQIEKYHGWFIATSLDMAGLIVTSQYCGVLLKEIPKCIKAICAAEKRKVKVKEVPIKQKLEGLILWYQVEEIYTCAYTN